MNTVLRNMLVISALTFATHAMADITFYEQEDFRGRTFSTGQDVRNLDRFGFRDRASSVVVTRERWEICDDSRFRGNCVVLRPGSYASLDAMGLNNRVAAVRQISANERIDERRYAPAPIAARSEERSDGSFNYRRRGNEQLFDAEVTSARAVLGAPEQRCWVEREQVPAQSAINVPTTIAGAVIGGILGHQIGGGRGKDLATVGGAVAGGFAGAQLGKNSGGTTQGQDVQRCENVSNSTQPAYWDVSYNFRGQEHQVQMTSQPGRTITVNRDGEPRSQ